MGQINILICLFSRFMYLADSDDESTEMNKVATNSTGVGNSAFTFDYKSNEWVNDEEEE